jgi:uncharacterized phage protein gp47/JayE
MADLVTDFYPLFPAEDKEAIRGRMDADANAGLALDDPEWIDTREGTFYWDITEVVILELARIWDALSVEVPACAFAIFAWGDYLDNHAATFGLERKAAVAAEGAVTFTGTVGTVVNIGTVVAVEAATDETDEIEFVTTETQTIGGGGTVTVAVEALESGADSNVSAGAVTLINSPDPLLTSVTNLAAISGGVDTENDEELRERILIEFDGQGGGRINDYKRWALSIAGVGRVFVQPVWAGPGTVQVVVMTSSGDPVAGSVVTAVQNYIDPTAGAADGMAPPGITVTVQTPAAVAIAVNATVTFKTAAYSLDGSGGLVEQRSIIEKALSDYIDKLDVGEDVIYNHVLAAFFKAEGVLNVSGLTVNGGTADIAITSSSPTQIAQLGTVTLV